MSDVGDHDTEMFRRTNLDDTTIERLLAGQPVDGLEMLASFVEDTQLATSMPGPQPSVGLAALFAEDFSTEKGDLLVTAASNVPGPAPQAAGLPKRRRKNMIELVVAKLAALGLAAKLGVATGALALTGTAAAFTGALPDAAQDPVADAFERAGIDIPGGRSAEHREDVDARDDADVSDADVPAQADFGTGVADDAKGGAPQDDGAQFGEDVSTTARQTYQPTDAPNAETNPGTGYRDDAGSRQPEGTPTGQPEGTPTGQPEGTPTGQPEGTPTSQPEGTPTADDNTSTSLRP